jgi:hypothetical protein
MADISLQQHIFPSLKCGKPIHSFARCWIAYPIARSVFGTPQDIKHPSYTNMINRITEAVKTHPHVIMVAGHEHALQLIKDSSYNYIISGSGCKTSRLSPTKSELAVRPWDL